MKNVTIVGGGLVGSLLAAYLGKRGYKVDVYERRSDMRKANMSAGKSINMACSTRGWRALDYIGVGERIREAAIPMYGRVMHSEDGELTHQPYGGENQAIYSISRGGLNKILMSYAEESENVKFHFDHKCLDVDVDNAVVTFKNEETGKSVEVKSDLVFGADGAFSAVRGVMQKLNHFTYSQTYISSDYKELCIPDVDGEFALENNALHIWPRGEYMLIALPNPDGSFTCTLFMPFEGKESFENLNSDEEIRQFFQKTFPDAYELMPTLLDDFRENPQSSLAVIRCYPWTHKDKVALIGDASHGIVPFYGQGMIAGFEDCYVLAQLMDEHGDDNWEKIFKEYQISRKPNGDAIANLAIDNYVVMRDKVADPDFLLRKKLERRIHELYPNLYTPLYSMVSFSNIPYAEAYEKGKEQERFIDEIMDQYDIAELFNTGQMDEVIYEFMGAKVQ